MEPHRIFTRIRSDNFDMSDPLFSPFAVSYRFLQDRGWTDNFPLQARSKDPLDIYPGWHGRNAVEFTEENAEWYLTYGPNNIALRSVGVCFIDVDAYVKDGKLKQGEATYGATVKKYGDPGKTFINTSRPMPSGHRIYRYHLGMEIRSFGPGIEVKTFENGYVVGPTSIHPDTGEMYKMYDPDLSECDTPSVDQIPFINENYEIAPGERKNSHYGNSFKGFDLQETPTGSRRWDLILDRSLQMYAWEMQEFDQGRGEKESRHQIASDFIWAAAHKAQGFQLKGFGACIDAGREIFLATQDKDESSEWDRMVAGAVRRVS